MRVTVRVIGGGLHPNEVVVQVDTAAGAENLVVDKRALQSESVAIGTPLQQRDDLMLIELPRESMSGKWRVWVKASSLKEERAAA